MNREQACDVLGLNSSPNDSEVIEAHRRLMQKLHPDKGGNAYLAQQLNEAKRVLLQK
jgi:DnaJ-class molecular chaperone